MPLELVSHYSDPELVMDREAELAFQRLEDTHRAISAKLETLLIQSGAQTVINAKVIALSNEMFGTEDKLGMRERVKSLEDSRWWYQKVIAAAWAALMAVAALVADHFWKTK